MLVAYVVMVLRSVAGGELRAAIIGALIIMGRPRSAHGRDGILTSSYRSINTFRAFHVEIACNSLSHQRYPRKGKL